MVSENIELILIVSGGLTASMLIQAFMPRLVVQKLYGEDITGNAAFLCVRHWGILVFCLGALLLWAAKHPEIRNPILIAAIFEKLTLVFFILTSPYKRKPLPLMIVGGDAIMAFTYIAFLMGF